MFCLYYFRTVLLLLVALVVFHSSLIRGYDIWSNEPQTAQNVDALLDAYLSREQALWNIVRSSGDNQDRTVHDIYETHKKYMGKNFGEIGIFRLVAKELSAANRTVIDNILSVNTTFEQGYELLRNRMYDRMPTYTADVVSTYPVVMREIKRAILDKQFWKAVINVIKKNVYNQSNKCAIMLIFLF